MTVRQRLMVVLCSVRLPLGGCHGTPTSPTVSAVQTEQFLQAGRWAAGPGCLTVSDTSCDLFAGCWHGTFPRPRVSDGGSFTAEGTYQFEAGPVRDESGQAARFSGSVSGDELTLTVERDDRSVPATSFVIRYDGPGQCTQLCL